MAVLRRGVGLADQQAQSRDKDCAPQGSGRAALPWLLDHLAAGGDDIVLDVAGGTGIVSRALADRVAGVVVVDTTPAMIDAGRRHATDERLTNLEFVRGEVANLRSPTRRSPSSSPASCTI